LDEETGLAYNRFRYYDNESGNYLSQDPIGLNGGNNFYEYVKDTNHLIDEFGLTASPRSKALPDHLQRRPKWQKSTKEHLEANNPKTADGKFIDVKTQKPIEPGNEVIGHQGQSWREYQEDLANLTKTRKQVIADYNDVNNLGFENKTSSSSDGGKLKGHEH
jgi:uncharacterized protein RhaS with RHS repeats